MKPPLALLLAIGATILGACSPRPDAPPLRVAAASDLKFVLDTLIDELRVADPDFAVEVTYGSSGNLRVQIEQGAPFDLYLSADMAFPEMLAASGHAIPETLFPYALGRLVLWVPKESPIDVERLRERALLAPGARRVAIANPEHAPYGQAAVAALNDYGILAEVEPRFVVGENIAQAAQFVESGAADIGILALSLAKSSAMEARGRYWEIPLDRFPRMLQGGVITSRSRQREAAERLRAAVLSEHGREVFARYGFILPDEEGRPHDED